MKRVLRTVAKRFGVGAARLVYEGHTTYNHVHIVDRRGVRYLVFVDPKRELLAEHNYQSAQALARRPRQLAGYCQWFLLGCLHHPLPRRFLVIGVGDGTLCCELLALFPSAEIVGVELDGEVLELAHRYFGRPRVHPRLSLHVGDGRERLARDAGCYDVIIIDAFFATSIHHSLNSREFLCLCRKRLTRAGVVALNLAGTLSGSRSDLALRIIHTYMTTFPGVHVYAEKPQDPRAFQNVFTTGLCSPGATAGLADRYQQLNLRGGPGLAGLIRHRTRVVFPPGIAPLLDADSPPGGVHRF